jgi:glutamyl-tRNA synthetase
MAPESTSSIPASILSANDRNRLVELLFPDREQLPSLEALEAQFPSRSLPAGAMVTRVAPSPTGFAHIGLVYMALLNRRFAQQTNGCFILRIEDTDSKREVQGAFTTIVTALNAYGITPDEGFVLDAGPAHEGEQVKQVGDFGPYLQSERLKFYRACALQLVKNGLAYPCFCSEAELSEMSADQQGQKLRPGYYGYWAKWRDRSVEAVEAELKKGTPFVIRLRSFGGTQQRVSWVDGVKGKVSMPENDLDIVLIKSDGGSLYHLAHAIDDHLMRITHVLRGDEWLSSVPVHLQIFKAFGWEPPHYTHLTTIQKLEVINEVDPETGATVARQSKRKLSKRKDPEANAFFYLEQGVPPGAAVEYLLNLANSDFEDWRKANPTLAADQFRVRIEKLSSSAALADPMKLANIGRDFISRMDTESVYTQGLVWAKRYDPSTAEMMQRDSAYVKAALNIERGGAKPSKRIASWQDLKSQICWFFDDEYQAISSWPFPEHVDTSTRAKIGELFLASYNPSDDKDTWFAKCKQIAPQVGFAAEMKQYKAEPAKYKGHIGDLTNVIRVALCGSRESPELCEVMKVLGVERVSQRLRTRLVV